jgi:hypothetical protein
MDREEILTPVTELYEDDPPSAVLTKGQRRYLAGETDKTDQQALAIDNRIRSRLTAALTDLSLIWRTLPEEEIEKIRPDPGEQSLPTDALAAWLYRLEPENAAVKADLIEDASPEDRDRRAEWVEGDVSRGVRKVIEHHEGVDATVEASVSVDRGVSLEELADGDLSELDRDQLTTLLRERLISDAEFGEAVRARISN